MRRHLEGRNVRLEADNCLAAARQGPGEGVTIMNYGRVKYAFPGLNPRLGFSVFMSRPDLSGLG